MHVFYILQNNLKDLKTNLSMSPTLAESPVPENGFLKETKN